MIILGIDPGLRVCGYAVVEAKLCGEKLIEAGVFRSDNKKSLQRDSNRSAVTLRRS